MGSARIRLACLWMSQGARVLADNALRLWVVFYLLDSADSYRTSAWHLVTLLLMLPAVVLAPLNGALCNSLPKPAVLKASCVLGLAAVVLTLLTAGPWLVCWGVVAVTAALYGPARSALLPAAAHDTHWPLSRINGWFEMGSALAIVGGFLLTGTNRGVVWSQGEAVPVILVGLYALAVLTAWPVRFPSDVRRPEPPGEAIAGFFRDCGRIFTEPQARGCLLALALSRGMITGIMGPVVASAFEGVNCIQELIQAGAWLFIGVALGSMLAGLQRHPRRVTGLIPFGAAGLAIGLMFTPGGEPPGPVLGILLGVCFGLVNVPLAATYQAALPADARGNGMAVRNFCDYLAVALMAGLLFFLGRWAGWSADAQLWLIAGIAAAAAVVAWRVLLRVAVEQLVEIPLSAMYRVRGYGPGLTVFPTRGPVLLIANHSTYLDPMLMAKVLPRELIAMMTSVFFDKPVVRWIMVHIARAIRVESSRFRREVPEIKEAIAALDRGDCVVLFPEGFLRRSAEQSLRQFGQGIWLILKERPATPVVVCWIEGGWGSFFSYYHGPPGKNKKLDFRRPIDIAVTPPQILPPELLAEHRQLRAHLMQLCLEARRHLGLEVLAAAKDEDEESERPAPEPSQ